MGDHENSDVENVREWIARIEAFASSLDDIEGDDATDFAEKAFEELQHLALPSVTGLNPCALIIFEAKNALAKTSTTVAMDWADTLDVRERHTRDSARRLAGDALCDLLLEYRQWLSEGLPSSVEIQQRFVAVAAELKESMDVLERRTAEMDAEDAEAAADPTVSRGVVDFGSVAIDA